MWVLLLAGERLLLVGVEVTLCLLRGGGGLPASESLSEESSELSELDGDLRFLDPVI